MDETEDVELALALDEAEDTESDAPTLEAAIELPDEPEEDAPVLPRRRMRFSYETPEIEGAA